MTTSTATSPMLETQEKAVSKEHEYTISLWWDEEAEVWISRCEDIYGFMLEQDSLDKLIARVRIAALDLLEVERGLPIGTTVTFKYVASRKEEVMYNSDI